MGEKWTSERFKKGYVENRKGVAYLRHADELKTTHLAFVPSNKRQCIKMLDEWLELKLLYPEEYQKRKGKKREVFVHTPNSVYDLAEEFMQLKFVGDAEKYKQKFILALRYWFPDDAPLHLETIYKVVLVRRAEFTRAQSVLYKEIQRMREMFRHAVKRGFIDRNPFELIELPKLVSKQPETFSPGEMQQIFNYFYQENEINVPKKLAGLYTSNSSKHPRKLYGLYYEFLYYTAMRKSEALNLTWHDIKEDYIHIHGKGDYDREFPLAPFPEVRSVLERLRQLDMQSEYLFPLNEALVYRWFMSALDANGIDRVRNNKKRTLHTIRASAEERFENELHLPQAVITDLAGHNLATYRKHYRTRKRASTLAQQIEELRK